MHIDTHSCAHTSTHLTRQDTVHNLLYTVLSDTSLGQYVFVPVGTQYPPQTDHLSNSAVIHGCRFVCLCLWPRCRLIFLPPARLQPPPGPSSLSSIFYLFPSFIHGSQSLHRMCFQLVVIPLSQVLPVFLSPLCFLSPFMSSFLFPLVLSPLLLLLLLPAPDLVRARTQYCIDWFPSVFSDLAVIVPERSRRIDFSEKDTVMFRNLLLHHAN